MHRPTLLLALIALTVASAVAAAVIPAGAYATRITIDQVAIIRDPTSLDVDVDGHHIVVHAPEGSVIARSGESEKPPRVDITIVSGGGRGGILVSIEGGPGPRAERLLRERDGRPIYVVRHGNGLAWEVVPGATVVVQARRSSQVEQLEVIEAIEVDP